jgi:hypothetical protein
MLKLIEKLKKLREVSPDANFFLRSHELISVTPQIKKTFKSHIWESFRMSIALSLASLLVIIGLGGFSYLKLDKFSPFIIGGLNTKSLAAEAERANQEFELAEAKYFEDTSRAVAAALNAVSQNSPDHLSNEVLEEELKNIEKNDQSIHDINSALDEI